MSAVEGNPWAPDTDSDSGPWPKARATANHPTTSTPSPAPRALKLGDDTAALTLAASAAAARGEAKQNMYQQRGACPDQVKARLLGSGHCHCGNSGRSLLDSCHRLVPLTGLQKVCSLYWALCSEERAFLVPQHAYGMFVCHACRLVCCMPA